MWWGAGCALLRVFGFVDVRPASEATRSLPRLGIGPTLQDPHDIIFATARNTFYAATTTMPRFPEMQDQTMSETTTDAKEEDDARAAQRIQVKNRRKRYLDLHPEYFTEPHLELAGR